MAAPQRPGASRLAWRAWELVPRLPTRAASGTRPDRRPCRAARRWRCTLRHRQHRGALPVMQFDEGCIGGRPGGPTRRSRPPGRPRLLYVRTRPSFAKNVIDGATTWPAAREHPRRCWPVGATGRRRRAMTGWLATLPRTRSRRAATPPTPWRNRIVGSGEEDPLHRRQRVTLGPPRPRARRERAIGGYPVSGPA